VEKLVYHKQTFSDEFPLKKGGLSQRDGFAKGVVSINPHHFGKDLRGKRKRAQKR